ncbi:MAG: ABC transporter substrate-binding protein [Ilumatobacteraceae bacterium]
MRTSKRGTTAALAVGLLALVGAACGSSKSSSNTTPATTVPATTAAGSSTTSGATTTSGVTPTSGATGSSVPAAGSGMKLTIDINPKAVWDDGSPITVADIQCTFDATMKTPGSLSTVGYDQIDSIAAGTSDKQAVVKFKTVYAPYKNLFSNLIKKAAVKNCDDVSGDLQTAIPFSGTEWKQQSWSKDQEVLVPNDKYWGPEKPIAKQVVIVPKADTDTEISSLKSGEVDFIFPQGYAGIADALNDPNIKSTPGYGTNYEGLYFQQKTGVFADAAFRQGFAHSIDRDLILKTIYGPIFPGSKLLGCPLWVPTIGKWCDGTTYDNYFDPKAAAAALTAGGYAKDGSGMWAKDGKVPTVKWVVNSGNKRRETTQQLMIPELKKQGFNVVQDNCDAACFFQKRLPALDYDMAMYINTASPDPTVTTIMACSQVPSDANGNKGQNSTGWCNKDASALMAQSDSELDVAKRVDEIHQIGKLVAKDAVMVPLFQFPNIAAWRTDKLTGPVDKDASNYMAFQNIWEWDPGASGKILIGAEQWPDCINSITECANSSWMVWTTAFKLQPSVWDTTAGGDYVPTALVTGEPKVEVLK